LSPFTGASLGPCKAGLFVLASRTIPLGHLNFNGKEPSLLIPASPMPKAKAVAFTPSDSQRLWKKDPRLKGLTFSKA
jgi:hypothetical protein